MSRYSPDHIKEMKRRILSYLWQTTYTMLDSLFREGHFKSIFEDMDIDAENIEVEYLFLNKMRRFILSASDEQANKYYKENADIVDNTPVSREISYDEFCEMR